MIIESALMINELLAATLCGEVYISQFFPLLSDMLCYTLFSLCIADFLCLSLFVFENVCV